MKYGVPGAVQEMRSGDTHMQRTGILNQAEASHIAFHRTDALSESWRINNGGGDGDGLQTENVLEREGRHVGMR